MRVVIDGEVTEVQVRVDLRWGPSSVAGLIQDRLPAKELLRHELIALNAAWLARRARLEEIAKLEERLDQVKSHGDTE
jgi:hypothetical protein